MQIWTILCVYLLYISTITQKQKIFKTADISVICPENYKFAADIFATRL